MRQWAIKIFAAGGPYCFFGLGVWGGLVIEKELGLENYGQQFYVCGLILTVPATFATFLYSQLFNLSSHKGLSYKETGQIKETIKYRVGLFGWQILIYVATFLFCIITAFFSQLVEVIGFWSYLLSSGLLGVSAFWLLYNSIQLREIIDFKLYLDEKEKTEEAKKEQLQKMEDQAKGGFKTDSDLESYNKITPL